MKFLLIMVANVPGKQPRKAARAAAQGTWERAAALDAGAKALRQQAMVDRAEAQQEERQSQSLRDLAAFWLAARTSHVGCREFSEC